MALIARPRSVRQLVPATCASDVNPGDHGTLRFSGGAYAFTPVDAGATTGEAPLVVVTSKPTSTTCVVADGGEVRGVYSGLTPGAEYFAGLSRQPVATPPTASSGHPVVFVQPLGRALAPDVLFFRPQPTIAARVFP